MSQAMCLTLAKKLNIINLRYYSWVEFKQIFLDDRFILKNLEKLAESLKNLVSSLTGILKH